MLGLNCKLIDESFLQFTRFNIDSFDYASLLDSYSAATTSPALEESVSSEENIMRRITFAMCEEV